MKKIFFISVVLAVFAIQTTAIAQMQGGMMRDSLQWKGMHHGMYPGMMNANNPMRNNTGRNMSNRGPEGMNSHFMMMKDFPISQSFVLINRLPKMQEELSLTDDQVFKLIDLQTAYKKQVADLKAELTKEKIKLNALVKNNGNTKDVGDLIKNCANTMANIGISAYDTSGKMKAILTDTQKQKLNEMFEKDHGHDYMDNRMDDN